MGPNRSSLRSCKGDLAVSPSNPSPLPPQSEVAALASYASTWVRGEASRGHASLPRTGIGLLGPLPRPLPASQPS